MEQSKFKYNRMDVRPLPVKLEHMIIGLSFTDGRVEGSNTLRLTARESLDTIRLDARDLDIRAVEWLDGEAARPLDHDYVRAENALIVRLPGRVPAGAGFSIRTRADCTPSDSILEGIYRDTTPPGCPPQYVSQCQQWGFQRILPVFDDCTAKCTMRTTIEADARYTHLISNGNVDRRIQPAGRPVLKPGDPTRQLMTYDNPVPMAPYLFLVCVGTWDVLEDEVVYPSGRRVKLEYLVPPGRVEGARLPMLIVKDSILWQGAVEEFEYRHDTYRTLCMDKSNFGGMENVGNTTIVTEGALVDAFTPDSRLEWAHGVIIHEYEHNQCGSEVTMESPFDLWLNEAFTVDVQRRYMMDRFGSAWSRLGQVDATRAPIGGPLVMEDSGHAGTIVRRGFNDPNELVDGVTYVKAAEVIRMLRSILGAETFRQAKNLYFHRYAGGNANSDQFFACFEEVSGRDLTAFKREWLHTTGYPQLRADCRYDKAGRRLTVCVEQSRTGTGGLFHLPLELAAVDADGRDIPGTARVLEITGPRHAFVMDDVPEPAFVSLNRDYSFYGTFEDLSRTPEGLRRQIRLDPNAFNRVEAMRQLTEWERIRLIREPEARVGGEWLDLYGSLVRDRSLPPGLKSYLLRIDEQSMDRQFIPYFRERYEARRRLMEGVAQRHFEELVAAFRGVDTDARPVQPRDGIEERSLKGTLLRILVEAGRPEVETLAESHFRRAWNITDRLSAIHAILLTRHPRRGELLEEAYAEWKDHPTAYQGYLGIVGAGVQEDFFDRVRREEERPTFDIRHPGQARALYMAVAANNRMLWSDAGIRWAVETVVKLAAVNEITASRLVGCFQLVHKLADDLRPRVLAALTEMGRRIDPVACPSVSGRIAAFLGAGR